MTNRVSHIALYVPDLRAAEAYYQTLFAMELIGREAEQEDGLWYTLPFDKTWDDAESAGVDLGMVGLQHNGWVLALFRGDAAPGQVFVIGLYLPAEEIQAVRNRLPADTVIELDEADRLEFVDHYGITWQLATGGDFQTAGVFADRWLKL